MSTPATVARNIFLGTGLGLMVVTGLLFSMGFLPPENCASETLNCISTNSLGWLIPLLSFIFLFLGILIRQKPEIFDNIFPNLSEEKRKANLEKSFLEEHLQDSKSSSAWTSLEKKLLIEKYEEE